jgi:AbrB family looped-hinge helix DNA binding protein
MDKRGRILIPKALRDRCGIRVPGKVKLVETPDGFLLERAAQPRKAAEQKSP